MSQLATTNRASIRYVKELSWGVTPNTAFQEIRGTAESMKPKKDTVESATIRSDRQVEFIGEVGLSTDGAVKTELSTKTVDFIAAALQGAWTTLSALAGTITLSHTAQTVAFSNVADYNVAAGASFIRLAGSTANNNGVKAVLSADAPSNTITLAAGSILADEDSTTNTALVLTANYVRNGVTPTSFTREVAFLDINKFKVTTGEMVTKLDLAIEAKKLVTLDFTTVAKDYAVNTASIAPSVTAAAVEQSASASVNVGAITDGTTPLATALSNLKISLNNNERQRPQVGSLFSAGLGFGQCVVTGSFSAYFADIVLAGKFLSHTAVNLLSVINLPIGKTLAIKVPQALLSDDQADVDGANKDLMENIQFKACVDPVLGYTIQIDLV